MEIESSLIRSTSKGLQCTPPPCAARSTTGSIDLNFTGVSDTGLSPVEYRSSPTTPGSTQLMRPCLAGTQSVNHHPEYSTNHTIFTNITRESSGLGSSSLEEGTKSGDPLSSFRNTPNHALNWRGQGSNVDSGIYAVDFNEKYLAAGHDYAGQDVGHASPKQKMSLTGNSHSKHTLKPSSDLSPIAGRESRMLEENLASVARYIEELTCPSSGTGQLHYENLTTSAALQSAQEQHQMSNRFQLQQMNQQLAATKPEKYKQLDTRSAENQELLRMLADKFPDLVMARNNLMTNPTLDVSSWLKSNESMNTSLGTLSANMYSNRIGGDAKFNLSNDSGLSFDSSCGSNVCDRRCHSDAICVDDGRKTGKYASSNQANNALMASHNLLSSQYQRLGLDFTNQLCGLPTINNFSPAGQLDGNKQFHLNPDACDPRKSALNILLATLQDRHPCMSSTPARDINKPLDRSSSEHVLSKVSPIAMKQEPSCSLSEELLRLAAPYQKLLGALENNIDQAANVYRNSASTIAQKSEAAYHWSGRLPVRTHRSMAFSRKVFLGGVPWDSTSDDLIMAFSRFGNVTVSWPQQEGHGAASMRTRNATPKGYCYLIFEHEASVNQLLAACVRDPITGGDYYKISTAKFKAKDVQVIPWVISDSQYTKSGPYRPDSKRTVFIGALHGKITAEALVTIMNDLFGNVVFAALDTDKYKYPIGSGRVAFSSHKSYMRAVTANFVDVRTSEFVKTVQIDPYLEDSLCNSCFSSPGIYFCRAFDCFRYFCPACWQLWHTSTGEFYTHKPLRRTFKPVI